MGCLAARINDDWFSSGKRHVRSAHADERRRGIAAPQCILRELHDGLMMEIAILLTLESALVFHGHLCVDA